MTLGDAAKWGNVDYFVEGQGRTKATFSGKGRWVGRRGAQGDSGAGDRSRHAHAHQLQVAARRSGSGGVHRPGHHHAAGRQRADPEPHPRLPAHRREEEAPAGRHADRGRGRRAVPPAGRQAQLQGAGRHAGPILRQRRRRKRRRPLRLERHRALRAPAARGSLSGAGHRGHRARRGELHGGHRGRPERVRQRQAPAGDRHSRAHRR